MIHIALIGSKTPGNIGAIARVMKNFDVSNLILVNPQCNYLDSRSIARSKNAKNILKKSKVVKKFSYLKKFDYIIGTTAIQGSDYNIPRVALSPEQLADKIKQILLDSDLAKMMAESAIIKVNKDHMPEVAGNRFYNAINKITEHYYDSRSLK